LSGIITNGRVFDLYEVSKEAAPTERANLLEAISLRLIGRADPRPLRHSDQTGQKDCLHLLHDLNPSDLPRTRRPPKDAPGDEVDFEPNRDLSSNPWPKRVISPHRMFTPSWHGLCISDTRKSLDKPLCVMNATYLKQDTNGERISPVATHTDLLFEARMRERKRIAQELHDTLLQGFTGIGLKLEALARSLPSSLAPFRAQVIKFLEESEQYLAEARRAIWELRSPLLQKSGDFSSVIAKVSQRALESTDIHLSFSIEGTERPVEPFVEANLLRICQEAVANAAKHAHPTRVEVFLAFGPKGVQLCVSDDGCGFAPTDAKASNNGHFGLLGIEERVAALRGILSVKSAPGRGTILKVTIPINGTTGGKAQENPRHGRHANGVSATSTL